MEAPSTNLQAPSARCVRCDKSFTAAEIAGADRCPNCRTKSLPLNPKDDLTIRINLHELHVLCVWAENYAVTCDNRALDNPEHESLKETVNIIAERLEKQLPRQFALTLSREIKVIERQFPDAQFFRDGREEIP
jgi:hypothetical protein